MNANTRDCSRCGSFMKKGVIDDFEYQDEVVQWWMCPKCGLNYPEHLYFKSQFRNEIYK
uniref:Uncharacterized protein n=1 Tax=viral metagenome TaxID=1070528 RepID=A0A6M3M1P7_9ZZZZ